MNRSYPVTRGNFRRLFASPHFWVLIALTVLYMEYIFQPIRLYLQESGSKIGFPDLMVYYMNDSTVSGFMVLGCLGMLFNAPCADDMQRYLMLRCGRADWAKGQIRYCLWVCGAYMLVVALAVFFLALPYMEFSLKWSPGILAFVDDFIYEVYDSFLDYDVWIPRVYAPLAAFGLEFVLHVLVCFALGMLMANVNMILDRRFGFAVIAAPLTLDLLLQEYFSETVKYFSPLTLCRLSGLDYGDGIGRPPVWFAFTAVTAAGILLSVLFRIYVRRHEIRI